MTEPSTKITGLLQAWNAGHADALERLVPLVYAELRRGARHHSRREAPGQTLQPTALVNEVYLRLVHIKRMSWQSRTHFFAMCSRLMRQILVDVARARRMGKRGGAAIRLTIDADLLPAGAPLPDLVALDDALTALERADPRKCRVVELRFFAGLSTEETADVLGVSTDTVSRDWKFAKSWLLRELRDGRPAPR